MTIGEPWSTVYVPGSSKTIVDPSSAVAIAWRSEQVGPGHATPPPAGSPWVLTTTVAACATPPLASTPATTSPTAQSLMRTILSAQAAGPLAEGPGQSGSA